MPRSFDCRLTDCVLVSLTLCAVILTLLLVASLEWEVEIQTSLYEIDNYQMIRIGAE